MHIGHIFFLTHFASGPVGIVTPIDDDVCIDFFLNTNNNIVQKGFCA